MMSVTISCERTARSAVVFNCPAVHGCLGWKLGEYLTLRKAIISTDLGRRLPAPLVRTWIDPSPSLHQMTVSAPMGSTISTLKPDQVPASTMSRCSGLIPRTTSWPDEGFSVN